MMSEWISVDDKLPCTKDMSGWSEDVFIYTSYNAAGVAAYNKDGFWDIDLQYGTELVVYWMSVPPPPNYSMSWQQLLAQEN